ncbi:MAG: exostosin family protein [Verrucomicrobiota bacterium]
MKTSFEHAASPVGRHSEGDGVRPLRVYFGACVGAADDSPVVQAWKEAAALDCFGVHHVIDDPERADLILFVDLHLSADWRLRALLRHELVRQFPAKVMAYDERDIPWCALPGLCCGMPKRHFKPKYMKACSYYVPIAFPQEMQGMEPEFLFSFMGMRSHPIRGAILALRHPRSIVEDTSGFKFCDRSDPVAYDRQKARYISTMMRSKFVLCPRGAGTASIRLFETLAARRVPVIISDAWVPPADPLWDRLCLRIKERDVKSIPARLEAAEVDYPKMAELSRRAHEMWFSRPVIFHRMISECADLLQSAGTRMHPRGGLRYLELELREAFHRVRGSLRRFLQKSGLRGYS